MPTTRRKRTRNRKIEIPKDYLNLLLGLELENPFSWFYSDHYAKLKGEPTLNEVYQEHKEWIHEQWEKSGTRPEKGRLKHWGVTP